MFEKIPIVKQGIFMLKLNSKTKKIILGVVAAIICIITACRSVKSDEAENEKKKKYKVPASEKYLDPDRLNITVPPSVIEKSGNEKKTVVSNNFSKMQTKVWKGSQDLNDETVYLKTTDDPDVVSFVNAGNKKRMLTANLDLSDGKEYGILLGTARDKEQVYNLSGSVLRIHIYIPAELAAHDELARLNFVSYFKNESLYKVNLKGAIENFTFDDIGAGWHTIELNFRDKRAKLGSKDVAFKLNKNAMEKNKFIGINIKSGTQSKASAQILIDWVDIVPAGQGS